MHEANLTPPNLTQQDIERFWSYVDKTPGQGPQGECWRWKWPWRAPGRRVNPSKSPEKEYPRFHSGMRVKGTYRSYKCHRLAFYLSRGEWPHAESCHHCDVRDCCRPDHLFDGTHDDNMIDMAQKGRHFMRQPRYREAHRVRMKAWHERNPDKRLKGANVGTAKLQESDVLKIRQLFSEGWNKAELARRFSMSRAGIRKLINRKTWAHL